MMLAMAYPERSGVACHSLRRRSAVTYSVRVSANPPVTWRVTIFTPSTEGLGNAIEMRIQTRKDAGISAFSTPQSGYEPIFYSQLKTFWAVFVRKTANKSDLF